MLLPQAFIDEARNIHQPEYLTLMIDGLAYLERFPNGEALRAPMELLVGWARLTDGLVEEDLQNVPESERVLFNRARAVDALARVGPALANLEKAGGLDAEALGNLASARAFLAKAEKVVTALDGVRAPSFRSVWWNTPAVPAAALDRDHLPFPLADPGADGAALHEDLPKGTSRLEIRKNGVLEAVLEVDAQNLSGSLARVSAFEPPEANRGVPTERADREVAFFDWCQDQLPKVASILAPKEPLRSCSFCGKQDHEVKRLIAGPTALICNACVSMCAEILNDGEVPPEA